jgi:antitoxin YefM
MPEPARVVRRYRTAVATPTRAGHEPVVIVSLDDYQSLKETAYLLRSPENARRLITAIEQLESGGGTPHELAE